MKRILISLLFIISFQISFSQTFEKYISTPTDDVALDALEMSNGKYIILSQESAYDFDNHDFKINIYKLNANGDFIDSLEIIVDNKYKLLYTRYIFEHEDDELVIVGNVRDRITSDLQLYLAFINTELDFLKDTIIGDTTLSDFHADYLINEYGCLITTGYCENPANGNNIFFCEYDLVSDNFRRVAYDIQHVSTNNIVELPEINAYHAQYVFSGDDLIQINRDSLTIDTQIVGLPHFDPTVSKNIPGDSNYLVMGKKGNWTTGLAELAFRIMSNSGELIGEYTYGLQDTNCWFALNEADCIDNTSLYLGGTHNFTTYPPYLFPGERRWIFVNKLNMDGSIIWQHFYKGELCYTPYKILATSDGGALILSHKYDWNSPYPNQRDIHILKVDSNGYYSGMTNIDELSGKPLQILVYPNPATSLINIAAGSYTNLDFTLFNSNGQVLIEKRITGTSSTLSIDHLPSGIYIYIFKSDKLYERGKIVIQ